MDQYIYELEGMLMVSRVDGKHQIHLRNRELGASVLLVLPETMDGPESSSFGVCFTGAKVKVLVEVNPDTKVLASK